MRRLRITVAYDGTDFHGWQVQPGLPTIQGAIEAVLAEIEGAPVQVEGSGRTDAGVHALAQVAAFTLTNLIPAPNLRKAMNRLLPRDIRVLEVEEAAPGFHPRFAARAKRADPQSRDRGGTSRARRAPARVRISRGRIREWRDPGGRPDQAGAR